MAFSALALTLGVVLSRVLAQAPTPVPLAFCAGGDTAVDGRPNHCNFVWAAGTTFNGKSFKGNNHWWYKLYWSAAFPANMTTLRNDGKARMEIELYKPKGLFGEMCDTWNHRGLRDITMPNTQNFEKPPTDGCGSNNFKEEWKLEITNTKGFVANQAGAVAVDMDSVGGFVEGLEVNLSWVRVVTGPDPDIWIGKLTNYCDLGGGMRSPRASHPNAGILRVVIPACPS